MIRFNLFVAWNLVSIDLWYNRMELEIVNSIRQIKFNSASKQSCFDMVTKYSFLGNHIFGLIKMYLTS